MACYAAVGHDALISYVNLSAGVAEKTFPVSVTVQNLVLAPAWVYVMSGQSATPISVELATGAVTNSSFFFGTNGKLDTAVNAIYGTEDDTSPNDIVRYNITTGPITGEIDSPYQGNYCVNGPLWFSPEGQRIYTGCGTIFHASTDPNLDRYYLSSFPGIQSIAVNLDGTLCDANHPAAAGSYVVLYFTGGGLTNPGGVTGAIAGSELQYLAANALVTVGGQPATVTYAGSAPGIVSGVGQLNIRLGDGTPSGPAQPVILTVGLDSSPATATIAVK